jgi:flagellar biosynthesis/type III secretory pathway protein FliH
LEKKGNVGIKFDQMSCEKIVELMSYIELSPEKIWNAFETFYNEGFFYGEIEKEFGITPETHDKLIESFDRRLNEYKI